MKRSEAIKTIADILAKFTYTNLSEKYAEEVLTTLENAGMYPPEYNRNSGAGKGIPSYYVMEWEEE